MRMTSLVAALGVVALVGCAKKDADDQAKTDTTPAANATPVTPAPDTTAKLNDANIAALLDEANAGDSATGKIATQKGTKADVKAFGTLMMRDHHALRVAGLDLVKKLNVTPTPPANDSLPNKVKAAQDDLNSKDKGADWDAAYINGEIATHQMVLGLIDQADAAAQAPELKALLKKARPNIEMHLKRAQDIQGKLNGATADSSASTKKKKP
jgi:putative membrane protein